MQEQPTKVLTQHGQDHTNMEYEKCYLIKLEFFQERLLLTRVQLVAPFLHLALLLFSLPLELGLRVFNVEVSYHEPSRMLEVRTNVGIHRLCY